MTSWKLAEKETDIVMVEKLPQTRYYYGRIFSLKSSPRYHPLPLDELRVERRRETPILLDGMTQKNQEILLRATNANPCGHTACSILDGKQ